MTQMSFALTPEREQQLQEILERYPNREAACIPVLHLCQEQAGSVTDEVVGWVAAKLGLAPAQVFGVATFYSLLSVEPVGKHQVWVCRTLSCALRGSDRVIQQCEKRLGIRCGETTPDGRVTLRATECLASCGSGPVLQVDKDYHENVTPEAAQAILDRLLGPERGDSGPS